MSVLVVGSTALDSIKTPVSENPRLLGGSASHAAVAASFFATVKMVGVVGKVFQKKYISLYQKHKIDLEGLQIADGETFHWSGEYEINMNKRRTLNTVLGVFETFTPHLPQKHKDSPYVLLANIAPSLQHHVVNSLGWRSLRPVQERCIGGHGRFLSETDDPTKIPPADAGGLHDGGESAGALGANNQHGVGHVPKHATRCRNRVAESTG